jgi:hypothetical protein
MVDWRYTDYPWELPATAAKSAEVIDAAAAERIEAVLTESESLVAADMVWRWRHGLKLAVDEAQSTLERCWRIVHDKYRDKLPLNIEDEACPQPTKNEKATS